MRIFFNERFDCPSSLFIDRQEVHFYVIDQIKQFSMYGVLVLQDEVVESKLESRLFNLPNSTDQSRRNFDVL